MTSKIKTTGPVVDVDVEELVPHPDNPRRGDIDAIRESIRVNGFYGVLIVRAASKAPYTILAGRHRWEAAKLEGMKLIPVQFIKCTDAQAIKIVLADNQTSDLARNDEASLARLLQSLDDFEGTGFKDDDLSLMLAKLDKADQKDETDEADKLADRVLEVTRPGDIIDLGPHRIVHGDSANRLDVERLFGDRRATVIVTSPPYADRRVYEADSGFVPIHPDSYVEWFSAIEVNLREFIRSDGSFFLNIKAGSDGLDMETYVFDLVLTMVREWGWHLATELCWERSGVPGRPARRFRNQFEPVYQFARGEWKFRPKNVRVHSDDVVVAKGPGSGNSNWANIQGERDVFQGYDKGEGLAYPGNRLPTFASTHQMIGHPAAFPVGLPEFLIRAYSDEDDVVFDPFLGSGSTLLAAENSGRIGLGMEMSPHYIDQACARWQLLTGDLPVRDGERLSFLRAG